MAARRRQSPHRPSRHHRSRRRPRPSAYILRDGVTRDGAPGQLYDKTHDDVDNSDFLARQEDRYQFRVIVSPEDSARMADLKPFVWGLMQAMERDLDTKLDCVAVDHFNTGHPHTHII